MTQMMSKVGNSPLINKVAVTTRVIIRLTAMIGKTSKPDRENEISGKPMSMWAQPRVVLDPGTVLFAGNLRCQALAHMLHVIIMQMAR